MSRRFSQGDFVGSSWRSRSKTLGPFVLGAALILTLALASSYSAFLSGRLFHYYLDNPNPARSESDAQTVNTQARTAR
jgi:hypothetical protein